MPKYPNSMKPAESTGIIHSISLYTLCLFISRFRLLLWKKCNPYLLFSFALDTKLSEYFRNSISVMEKKTVCVFAFPFILVEGREMERFYWWHLRIYYSICLVCFSMWACISVPLYKGLFYGYYSWVSVCGVCLCLFKLSLIKLVNCS